MSDEKFDKYEHYNYEQDKHVFAGHSGKQRTKREVGEQRKQDPAGHSRKIVTNMANGESNRKESDKK